ncbi:beta-ketoacyl synthase N-terminal-like domain-containing protein [Streptomyces sp. MH60]|uniref:beta-ketoacyl synthase N-terminal-like domain-containing protein n=1 Tax=Streptomyces sp. MH60 TaxID=1940758 RepID=UPI000CEDD710|nr:beta-ketoacyl synthase N-terminal-like domain-containing protein [Streptomyces sp. MH60]
MSGPAADGRAVVVTGLGVLGAVATGPEDLTAALRSGRCALSAPSPPADADRPGVSWPAFTADLAADDVPDRALETLPGLPDALRGAARRTVLRAPVPVRTGVVAALQAWLEAGLDRTAPPPERIGVAVAGNNLTERVTEDGRARAERNPAHLPARYALQHQDTDHVATLSRVLGLRGEGCTVGGASASGNLALVHGARMLTAGAADVCLVVGAMTRLSRLQTRGFLTLGAMAPADGAPPRPPAPFDTGHRGFHPGQAAACMVLETAASARLRGAPALAGIAGGAVVLDGNHLADPSVDGEARAMSGALARAGVGAADIGWVSAHGTGSPLGDRTEADALRKVFGADDEGPWINATKTLSGHCLSAAGVVEAVAAVLQLRAGFVHPDPGLREPVDAGLRFVRDEPRRASGGFVLSNGFGFGGINTAVVLAHPDA